MKNVPWKKITIGAVVAVIALGGVLYFNNAKSLGPPTSTVDPAFGEYISSYTAGVVSSGSFVRVVLSTEVIDSTALGETSIKLFDFSPSIKGTTVWLDRHTVEFRPDAHMTSGQVYETEFALSAKSAVTSTPSIF